MKFIVFDTETTGLPKNYNAPAKDVENWPRVIMLAWELYDYSGNTLKSYSSLIKPDGWVVPNEKFWIENGYTTERCMKEGKEIRYVLEELIYDMNDCDLLIAHNMQFDSKVVGAEMYRVGLDTNRIINKLCTKELSTNYCKLPSKKVGQYKWPTLVELHRKLFGTGFENAHDALADVRACGRCFFELIRIGEINL